MRNIQHALRTVLIVAAFACVTSATAADTICSVTAMQTTQHIHSQASVGTPVAIITITADCDGDIYVGISPHSGYQALWSGDATNSQSLPRVTVNNPSRSGCSLPTQGYTSGEAYYRLRFTGSDRTCQLTYGLRTISGVGVAHAQLRLGYWR